MTRLSRRDGNVNEWYEWADLYAYCVMKHDIRHEVDGLLAQAGDVTALQSALDRLMGIGRWAMRTLQFDSRPTEAQAKCPMERIAGLW